MVCDFCILVHERSLWLEQGTETVERLAIYCMGRFLPGYLPSYTVPRKGDIVIFHDGVAYNHTGIVTEVHGKQFWTIEGNTRKVGEVIPEGYIVCEKSYDLQKLPNVRFCRPDYTLFQ